MITGKAGIGKTLLGLQIAWAITTGQSPLDGWEVPTPRRVLYVEGEMPAATLQARLRAIRAALPQVPASGYLRIVSAALVKFPGGLPDLSTSEGQEWLDARVDDAEVLLIDSITTAMPTQEQNEGHDWGPVQVRLLEYRRQGRTVILLHHHNKAGSQNGTERRMVPLDTAIDLRRPDGYRAAEGARFILEYTKNRGFFGPDAEPFELAYRTDDGKASWTRGKVGAPAGKRPGRSPAKSWRSTRWPTRSAPW